MVQWEWISYFGCDQFELKIVGFLRLQSKVFTFVALDLIQVNEWLHVLDTNLIFMLKLGGGVMGAPGFIAAQTVLANK